MSTAGRRPWPYGCWDQAQGIIAGSSAAGAQQGGPTVGHDRDRDVAGGHGNAVLGNLGRNGRWDLNRAGGTIWSYIRYCGGTWGHRRTKLTQSGEGSAGAGIGSRKATHEASITGTTDMVRKAPSMHARPLEWAADLQCRLPCRLTEGRTSMMLSCQAESQCSAGMQPQACRHQGSCSAEQTAMVSLMLLGFAGPLNMNECKAHRHTACPLRVEDLPHALGLAHNLHPP